MAFLALANLVLNWVVEIRPEVNLIILNAILGLVFLGFLLPMVGVQVFGEGPASRHRIRAS